MTEPSQTPSAQPSSSSDPVLQCVGLAKTYRDFWGRRAHPALCGLDLSLGRGESHALLGPNGSGKTTTLRLLLGLIKPTEGSVRLFGGDPRNHRVRSRVGFLPEDSALHGFLTCTETLDLFASFHPLGRSERRARVTDLLGRVALADASRKKVRELSHGMRRRLALAVALVGRPDLLVLDEPTAGMDPLVREGILALFREHVERGGTLLVTSHLLGDLSGIATRATLLARGKVVREGDLAQLLRRDGVRSYQIRGDAALDDSVRAAVEAAGGQVLEAGPGRETIEGLFIETYRDHSGDQNADHGGGGSGA